MTGVQTCALPISCQDSLGQHPAIRELESDDLRHFVEEVVFQYTDNESDDEDVESETPRLDR